MEVWKFGGTSVATPERIREIVGLVRQEPGRRVVVVSALGGVTDQLLRGIDAALARSDAHRDVLTDLRARHDATVEALTDGDERERLQATLAPIWDELGELLDGVYLLRECTRRTRDAILATGERLSVPIVAAAFRAADTPATALDARSLIQTDGAFGEAEVQFGPTEARIREQFETLYAETPEAHVMVVTGFIAATAEGVTTTLGRSGSDYTATILARALQAERVVIWTDVDGVLSADPRLVDAAFPLERLSYREAAEMAYFGAKVLHPRTMRPVEASGIPLLIKNTMNPDAPGTLVTAEAVPTDRRVKAISTIRDVAVVMLEGRGLLGVPGTAARTFDALADRSINVLMISQASSEQSICTVVRRSEAEAAVDALEHAFRHELAQGDVSRVYALPDCAVVSAVGDQMRHMPGLAGRMFATLGRSGVNVLAIAQGAAETNISAVVRDADVKAAVDALHEAFPLRRTRAHLCVIGTGVVGSTLLDILQHQAPRLLDDLRLHLRLVGVTNSRRMRWDPSGLPLDTVLDALDQRGEPADLDDLVERLTASRLERLLVVDATASSDVARRYPELLEQGIGIVTPNKRANTLDMGFYHRLREAAARSEVSYRYEATVMAGLPVILTVRDLLRSGDTIERIEGVFSGTLAYLFRRLAEGASFSEAVREARAGGYTEPDPRDDLGGEDVARKLMILAREIGLEVERDDVRVEPLVPFAMMDGPVDAFMEQVDTLDAAWAERVAAAADDGKRLQYIGRVVDGRCRVGVEAIGPDSPFFALQGTDNAVLFTSERYRDNPLVVQGPGAGPAVTAAGILADLIKAAQLMP
ncbi:MAG: bifunctional aspartate kinase/homoserine dehydrogenase I [Bacteroidetes bacterium]|nr:bifunctional aspartate kinase/homoserine dehydrogenase I [Bacteroidota bacterium]